MKNLLKIFVMISMMTAGHPLLSKAQETAKELNKDGFYFGLGTGLWFPDGKNSVMGHPVLPGLIMELKSGKGSLSIVFDFVLNEGTKDTLYIKYNDELLKKNKFHGAQLGLDYEHEIISKNRLSVEAVGGLGVGMVTYHNPNKDIHIGRTSLYFNPGLGLRYFIGKDSYLKLKAQYYMANYRLKDEVSTDFRGNYPTLKLVYAWR